MTVRYRNWDVSQPQGRRSFWNDAVPQPRVPWKVQNVTTLYILIIANNCLHHFVDNGKQYWKDPIVADGYQNMFRHFAGLLKSDGRLIIREMDPFNVWRYVLPKLVFPTIDWSLHPPLSGWLDAIRKATFDTVYMKTVVPYKLRSVQKIFAKNMFRHLFRGGVLIYCCKGV